MLKMKTASGISRTIPFLASKTCLLVLLVLNLLMVEAASGDLPLQQHSHRTPLARTGSDYEGAAGVFLVADRSITDPRFRETVILMVRHDAWGSAGIVINRPSELKLSHLFPDRVEKLGKEQFVYEGGPVALKEMNCLMLLRNSITGAQRLFGSVYITSSRSVLEGLLDKHDTDERFRVYAGYAGWSPGQLAVEIARGQWKVVPADVKYLFDIPAEDIWPYFMRDSAEGLISI